MSQLPQHRPYQLSLGQLEREILEIIWQLGETSAKAIHEVILADPDRELTYASVMTVLGRLEKKGWVAPRREKRSIFWRALVTAEEAQSLWAYHQLQSFLKISNADMVAAFVDDLDQSEQDKLQAIAEKLQAMRRQRQGE
ncbi:MAG: BlaI/MecI/CopY family transcriptional regulator [Pseudanabaenaceae cyanobacterium]